MNEWILHWWYIDDDNVADANVADDIHDDIADDIYDDIDNDDHAKIRNDILRPLCMATTTAPIGNQTNVQPVSRSYDVTTAWTTKCMQTL